MHEINLFHQVSYLLCNYIQMLTPSTGKYQDVCMKYPS